MSSELMLLPKEQLDQLINQARAIAGSELLPKHFRGSPASILMAMQAGMELGFTPMMSLQLFTVINGKISMGYEATIARILADPECETFVPVCEGSLEDEDLHAIVKSKRKGRDADPDIIYTMKLAKQARLWDSTDAWKRYPEDMLIAKAVARAGRRYWPDKLRGVSVTEDMAGPVSIDVTPEPAAPPVAPIEPLAQDPARALLSGGSPAKPEEVTHREPDSVEQENAEDAEIRRRGLGPAFGMPESGNVERVKAQDEVGPPTGQSFEDAMEEQAGKNAEALGEIAKEEASRSAEIPDPAPKHVEAEIPPIEPTTENTQPPVMADAMDFDGDNCPGCERHREIILDVGHSKECTVWPKA